jgi:TIR domain
MGADTVFISYSHDSPEHSDNVLALANALIQMGLQVELDQFVTRPPQGWPHWCVERLRPESAKFVLMICTREYCDRIENRVEFDKGRGAYWEGALIHQYVYEGKGNTRFIPVLLDDAPDDCVPFRLRPYPRYRLKAFDFSDTELTSEAGTVVSRPADIVRNEPRIISLLWIGVTLTALGVLVYIANLGALMFFIASYIDNYIGTLINYNKLDLFLNYIGSNELFTSTRVLQYLYAVILLTMLFKLINRLYIVYIFSSCFVVELLLLYTFNVKFFAI